MAKKNKKDKENEIPGTGVLNPEKGQALPLECGLRRASHRAASRREG
jgi:hypothetical protein